MTDGLGDGRRGVAEYVAAAFTGIWVQSHEHPDLVREIAHLCRDQKWAITTWDVDRGLHAAGRARPAAATAAGPVAANSRARAQRRSGDRGPACRLSS